MILPSAYFRSGTCALSPPAQERSNSDKMGLTVHWSACCTRGRSITEGRAIWHFRCELFSHFQLSTIISSHHLITNQGSLADSLIARKTDQLSSNYLTQIHHRNVMAPEPASAIPNHRVRSASREVPTINTFPLRSNSSRRSNSSKSLRIPAMPSPPMARLSASV